MTRVDGYVADIEYVHNFCSELGPSSLNLVLAIQGVEPIPLESGFSCCDLGCGQGLSTNIFAACHPEGQFHAIDFNNAHIVGARELAEQAHLTNVRFWEATFEEIGTLHLPEFDFITLHGVYSWVNAKNRTYIVDFINQKLKPGGAVYISYNCLPGWSSFAPIRQLLISCADSESGCLEERMNAAIDYVGLLKSMNVSYFSTNPAAASFFDELSKRSRNYLAHEYFNEHWVPFYHAEVTKNLAPAGITYVGSARFVENFDFLRFSLNEQQMLNEISDPVLKETVKDYAVNQQFRRDVFANGRTQLTHTDRVALISRLRFALIVTNDINAITLSVPRFEMAFAPALYTHVLSALSEQHCSLDELLQNPDIAQFGPEMVTQALMVLLSAGYILPAVTPSPEAVASSRLFNYRILERVSSAIEPQYLASPVVQSGIRLDWIQQLLLVCELTETIDPLSFVSGMMRDHNYALIKDGAALVTWEQNMEELKRQIRSFRTFYLPLLLRLEVV